METRIPITAVDVGEEAEQLVVQVLRSGQLAQGPMVERLEAQFAKLCHVPHAVAVSSGTTALVAVLRSSGLGPGDEVITSPFTFVATLNAILEAGAVARFADVEPATFTLDPDHVATQVGPRSRAVMPVHLYGQPADMDRLMPVANRHGLLVVEDAAQAHGARSGNRPVGSFGIGCFSLYATKNVTSGEGGVITTNDGELADRLRVLRNQGMRRRYEYEMVGHNYRLTDVQAAIAIPQLDRLTERTAQRRRNAGRLTAALEGLPGVVTPAVADGREHVFHQYTVRITEGARYDRDTVAARLRESGIDTGIYYPKLVHDYDCYRSHPQVISGDTPEAARAARQVLSLPVHSRLGVAEVERVAEALHAILS